jgi:uncharacterized protein YcfJ
MNRIHSVATAAATLLLAARAEAQVTFYQDDGFRGPAFTTDRPVGDLTRFGFNDRASSAIVEHGRWEVCEQAGFQGHCVVLRHGSYDSLRRFGLNDRISSVRPVDERRVYDNESPEPLPEPNYEYRRRAYEPVFQAPVTSVHAVVGPPQERCWVEREQVYQPPRRDEPNVGGAIVGALVGGILGHQIGEGRGRDVATIGGAAAGGAIGANVGRGGGEQDGTVYDQDVRRCEQVPSTAPDYWDVTYEFQGYLHRVQMAAPPGPTIIVNGQGEPRQ